MRSYRALLLCLTVWWGACAASFAGESAGGVIAGAQAKIVKLFGAGGVRGLEPYQSGFLVSDNGYILTVWSYVLDTDFIGAVLDDGRRFEAHLVDADPRLEVALLKIDASDLPHFNIRSTATADGGTRVLAFSNLFGVATGDEAASVQHGVVAVKTRLDARRGTFETPYRGPVYVLDAMTNNPGAPGGALTNLQGELLAILGKELRNSQNNIWLNYAVPVYELRQTVEDMLAGKERTREETAERRPDEPLDLTHLGIVLVPDVLERTPPYVEEVRSGSPAAQAGILPDDLVIFVGETIVQSCKSLKQELARLERSEPLKLILMRRLEMMEVNISPASREAQVP